jgi:hypothetical protein
LKDIPEVRRISLTPFACQGSIHSLRVFNDKVFQRKSAQQNKQKQTALVLKNERKKNGIIIVNRQEHLCGNKMK